MHVDNSDTIGRFGYISDYDHEKHYARVEFPDLGIVSSWLPVAVWNSKDNHDEKHFDIGEHVYCLLHDNTGIVLCAVYDNNNNPPVANKEIRAITFKDETTLTYDRENHITDFKDCNENSIHIDENGIDITDCNGNNIHLDDKGITITSCADIIVNAADNYENTSGSHTGFTSPRIDLN